MRSKTHRGFHGPAGKLVAWLVFLLVFILFSSPGTISAAAKGVLANVIPTIKINGTADYIIVADQSSASQLLLSISWNPYELNRSKWEIWLLALDADGFKYFDLKTQSWISGFLPTYSGKNIDYLPTTVPVNGINFAKKSVVFFAIADKKADKKITSNLSFIGDIAVIISTDLKSICTEFTYGECGECSTDGTCTRQVLTYSPENCTGGNPITELPCNYVPPPCTTLDCHVWGICQPVGEQICTNYDLLPPGCIGPIPLTKVCIPDCTSYTCKTWSACVNGKQQCTEFDKNPPGCNGTPPPQERNCTIPCTSYDCLTWGGCQANGTQTCTSTKGNPDGCAGTAPVLTQPCTPSCTSWVCDVWPPDCPANGTKTCTSSHGLPIGCQGTSPILTQSCTPICTECTYTSWGVCQPSGLKYRTLISKSPPNCDGCLPQESMACIYTPSCTSWVCDVWPPDCPANGTKTCASEHGLPPGCQGIPQVLTQSCVPTCSSWTCNVWGVCQPNNTQTCQSATGSPAGCSGTTPTLTQACQYQDNPVLVIDHWPVYGTSENLTGHITGVSDPTQYKIIPYIEVESLIWSKPTLATPYCPVAANGTFTCDVTTGGNDIYADRMVLHLVKNDYAQPSCFPCYELPLITAFDTKTYDRLPDVLLNFAGRIFRVKRADYQAGPGPTRFCDASNCVWVDTQGLHLTIKNINGQWFGTEVILNQSLGYGTYILQTHGRVDNFDQNVVFGFFTWDPVANTLNFREFDHEVARWGNPAISGNAQHVKQPCNACPGCGDNCNRYTISQSDTDQDLTFYLVWQPGSVELRTYKDHHGMNPPASDLISTKKWTDNVVAPGTENIRFNFWLYGGNPPANGQNHSVLITDFQYQSGSPVWNSVLPGNPGVTVESCGTINDTIAPANGQVTGIDPNDYKIAVYILVRGGWWTKPYWSTPLTSINADGSWTCDIITGGVDYEATQVRAYLVPSDYNPPSMSGGSTLPAELDQNSIAKSDCMR